MQKIKQLQRDAHNYQNRWFDAGKKLQEQKGELEKLFNDNAQLHAASHRAGLELQGEASHSDGISSIVGQANVRDLQMRGQF